MAFICTVKAPMHHCSNITHYITLKMALQKLTERIN